MSAYRLVCSVAFLVLSILLSPSLVAQPSPVAYWALDAATGCFAADAEAEHPGTLGPACPANGPTWTEGVEVNGVTTGALVFDGVDDYVRVPASSELQGLGALSMAAWIRHSPTDTYTAIIDQRETASDGFDLYLTSSSRLFIRVNQSTLEGTKVVADGQWHHVAGVYDGTRLRLYVDGVLDAERTIGAMVVDADADLFLGRHFEETNVGFDGALDEVYVFDTGLSEADVAALFALARPPQAASVSVHWDLDEGTGCAATDQTGTHTLQHGPNCPADGPAWLADGVAQGGLVFDGQNDALRLAEAETASFRGLEAVSVAAWIKHAPTSSYTAVVDHREAAADGYDLYLNPSSQLFMRVNQATLTGATPVADGRWHHVAGVYDGTTITLYVDGVVDAQQTVGTFAVDAAADLLVGHHFENSSFSFGGAMDELHIANYALSAAEVEALADYVPPMPDIEHDYYIDAEAGNDAYPGTQAQPFKTLQRCVDLWQRRDAPFVPQISCHGRGVFNEEVYVTGSGPSAEQRNQIIAWDTDADGDLTDETFVLDGENSRNIAIRAATNHPPANIEIAYLTAQNYYPVDGWACGPDFDPATSPRPADENVNFIHLRGSTEGSSNWWIHHNTFRNLAVGCSIMGHMIAIRPTNAPGLVLEDNTFENLTGFIMRYFGGSDIAIRRNQFIDLDQGINVWNAGGLPITNVEVTDNTFACRGYGKAITFADDVHNSVVRNNTFDDCKLGVLIGTDAAFGKRASVGHRIENNVMTFTDKVTALDVAGISIGDCSAPSWQDGTALEVRDVTMVNNVIRWVGPRTARATGISLRSGHLHPFVNDFRIAHNTLEGMETGLLVEACVAVQEASGGYVTATHHLKGVELVNNIFSNTSDDQIYLMQGEPRPVNFVARHNVYSGRDRWTWHDGTQHRPYLTFADWVTVSEEANGSRFCAPSFAETGDYHLLDIDTCALDSGVPLAYVSTDIDGDERPAGAAPDVGADEASAVFSKASRAREVPDPATGFTIETLYPNPTTATTTIQFVLDTAAEVHLEVFDILGRRVAMVDSERLEAGRHERIVGTAGWPSGLYQLRLVKGGQMQHALLTKVQ